MASGTVQGKDVIVIGAGISGLATAKCLKDDGFDVIILERSTDIGGLWTFREQDYGVMRFTHINVSKYNYAFSDYPFPDNVPDYPHHSDMANYVRGYANKFGLNELVHFRRRVISVERTGEKWRVTCCKIEEDGKTNMESEERVVYVCANLAIATGHHAKPAWASFRGEDTFPGKILHSVDYNDSIYNDCAGKRVLVVGIGNSAVDAAVDCATVGRCPTVYLSTRSGTWIVPNYIFGFPTDLYACRFWFLLPRSITNFIFGFLITVMTGNPWKWGLNPKMEPLATQPTVSPTLIHHIQRGNIKIVPHITRIEGSTVHFVNGSSAEFDRIIYCTGYKIDLPYLPESIQKQVVGDSINQMKLFKNVFAPEIGPSLAFIGFVQPASGGILCMSEIQARWFSELCKGKLKLPSKTEIEADMAEEQKASKERWYQSARHTIQKDPMIYTDNIASFIGAKPDILANPTLAWRLLFSSCGASQWRLNGPHKWDGASQQVKRTPLVDLWNYTGYVLLFFLLFVTYYVLSFVFSFLSF